MQSILIPIIRILRNPFPSSQTDRCMEVSGWAECLLRSVVEQRFTFLDVQLNIALSLTLLDTEDSIGKIVSRTIDRVKMKGNEAAILEKKLAISGFHPGSALSLVFKLSGNQVDISHMRLLADDGKRDLETLHVT